MWGKFERVYAVTDYVDGILAGVAAFRGAPHVFELERLDDTLYRLTPVVGALVFPESSPVDIWSPTPDIEATVRAAASSPNGGFLVRGEFRPVSPSPSLKPDLHVRWELDGV
jgi:hypothetical protein